MSIEAMVALVLIITQAVKEKLRELFPNFTIESWVVILLSLIISAGVALYNYQFKLNIPIDMNFVWMFLQVWVFSNFGKRFANSLFKPKPK